MIVFEKIRYKNFLSTGNTFIEIALDAHKTTLMVGKNGSGKSTILDAICFSLFGKPFRNINKPQLVNSINMKECVVEIEFSIGTDKYLVRRGIKPNIFDIIKNNVQLNKNADAMDYQKYLENGILKLNFKSFTQIVILGSSSFIPFMQLSALDRRVVVEDILDITIFSSINGVLKNSMTNLKDEIKTYDASIEGVRGKLEMQKEHIEKIEKSNEANDKLRQQDIDDTKLKIAEHNTEVSKHQETLTKLYDSIADKSTVLAEVKKIDGVKAQGNDKKLAIEETLSFYHENDDCPECKQAIDSQFKATMIEKKKADIAFIDGVIDGFKETVETANSRLIEIGKTVDKIQEITATIQEHSTQVVALNRYLDSITVSPTSTIDIQTSHDKLTDLQTEYDKLMAEKCELLKTQKLHDVAQVLLKDSGIKSKIIKQYLPMINTMINKYLSDLNFYASFHLDENFKEEIKSRNRDIFSYGSFSEGQKMRIDLALLFTWREVAKTKNSINTNLLFLDEIFDSSLDVEGTDEFMKLMNAVAGDSSIFLISHKTDQFFDKFQSVMQFEIKNNFTSMRVL